MGTVPRHAYKSGFPLTFAFTLRLNSDKDRAVSGKSICIGLQGIADRAVQINKRVNGRDVWLYRGWESTSDGRRTRRGSLSVRSRSTQLRPMLLKGRQFEFKQQLARPAYSICDTIKSVRSKQDIVQGARRVSRIKMGRQSKSLKEKSHYSSGVFGDVKSSFFNQRIWAAKDLEMVK